MKEKINKFNLGGGYSTMSCSGPTNTKERLFRYDLAWHRVGDYILNREKFLGFFPVKRKRKIVYIGIDGCAQIQLDKFLQTIIGDTVIPQKEWDEYWNGITQMPHSGYSSIMPYSGHSGNKFKGYSGYGSKSNL